MRLAGHGTACMRGLEVLVEKLNAQPYIHEGWSHPRLQQKECSTYRAHTGSPLHPYFWDIPSSMPALICLHSSMRKAWMCWREHRGHQEPEGWSRGHTREDWRGSFGQSGGESVEEWPNVFLWLTTVFHREDKDQLFLELQRKKIMNQQIYAAPREIIPGWRWEIPHEIRLVPGQGPRETVGYLYLLVFKAWRAVIRTGGWISFGLAFLCDTRRWCHPLLMLPAL